MTEKLVITMAAAKKVWELIQEEEDIELKQLLKLRVHVTGGGCSGLQYGFTFAKTFDEDDTLVSKVITDNQKIDVLVDPNSLPYLLGAEIDYKEDIEGAQFIIRNPNAKTTCGCGSSFSAD